MLSSGVIPRDLISLMISKAGQCMVLRGMVVQGPAWFGEVRQRKGSGSGSVLPFPVLLILARSGEVRRGRVWHGKARVVGRAACCLSQCF